MTKIRVRIEQTNFSYIHNDLLNAAYYFMDRLTKRIDAGEREGITLEIMAGLTMTAFAVEAQFNFLGASLISEWDERQNIKGKIELVTRKLGVEAKFGRRPYQSLSGLIKFRDTLAHGKPVTLTSDTVITTTHEGLDSRGGLVADWERLATIEFFNQAYEDADEVWKQLIDKSGLNIIDTLSGGDHEVTFIENMGH